MPPAIIKSHLRVILPKLTRSSCFILTVLELLCTLPTETLNRIYNLKHRLTKIANRGRGIYKEENTLICCILSRLHEV